MKKILLALAVLFPCLAFADSGFYQPPTPIAQIAVTPGTVVEKHSVDQYLNQGVYAPFPITANISNTPVSINTPTAPIPVSGAATGTVAFGSATLNMTGTNATPMVCAGAGSVKISLVSGSGTGNISAKGSVDNAVTYPFPIALSQHNSTAGAGYGDLSTYNVANGNTTFSIDCSSFSAVEILVSTVGTNTVSLTWSYNQTANHVIVDGINPGGSNGGLGAVAFSTTAGNGDTILKDGFAEADTMLSLSHNGNYTYGTLDKQAALWSRISETETFTHTQPSVTTATSFTCLAANTARHGFIIQNNSAANILINLNNGTLTGIVPTSSNLGIVLTPGSSYSTPANGVPTTAVTCYQTSGGTINTISVDEY